MENIFLMKILIFFKKWKIFFKWKILIFLKNDKYFFNENF